MGPFGVRSQEFDWEVLSRRRRPVLPPVPERLPAELAQMAAPGFPHGEDHENHTPRCQTAHGQTDTGPYGDDASDEMNTMRTSPHVCAAGSREVGYDEDTSKIILRSPYF